MNGLEGLIWGLLIGIVSTFSFIMLFAKYMNKDTKEMAINEGKKKWSKRGYL